MISRCTGTVSARRNTGNAWKIYVDDNTDNKGSGDGDDQGDDNGCDGDDDGCDGDDNGNDDDDNGCDDDDNGDSKWWIW